MRDRGIEAVTLAVLAGGAGSRMGGAKDRVRVGGRPVLVEMLDRLAWDGRTVLVVAPGRREVEGAERFGTVVTDAVEGEGPLRGVATALNACATERLVVMPLDMPGMGREQVDWVMDRAERESAACVMLERDGGIEPFPLFIRRAMADEVRRMLERGERSVRALATISWARVVEAPAGWGHRVWANLNRPEDVAAFVEGAR